MNNEDTLQASGSYDITSPEDDSKISDDGDYKASQINTSSPLKAILVHPSSDDDGEETIHLTFPNKSKKKSSFELDDYEFRALTKENTMRNHVNFTTTLKTSDVRILNRCNHDYYTA